MTGRVPAGATFLCFLALFVTGSGGAWLAGPSDLWWTIGISVAGLGSPLFHFSLRRLGWIPAPRTLRDWFIELAWQSTLFLPYFLLLGSSTALWLLPQMEAAGRHLLLVGTGLYLVFLALHAVFVFFELRTLVPRVLGSQEENDRVRAFRGLQMLPYRLVRWQLALVLVLGLAFHFTLSRLFLVPEIPLAWFLVLGLLFTLAAYLIQVPYLQALVAPAMRTLVSEHPMDFSLLRSPLSLKFKLRVWFGMLAFLAIAISATWSLLQQWNNTGEFALRLSRERVRTLVVLHQERLTWGPQGDPGALMHALLAEAAEGDDGLYYWLPRQGGMLRVGPNAQPVRLPVALRSRLRSAEQGELEWVDRGLYGYFRTMYWKQQTLGTLAVLYPQDPSWAQLGSRSKILRIVVFFVLLFLLTFLGVTHFVHELVTPLSELEKQFHAITAGKMRDPVLPRGEVDELGRLSFAFERMRATIVEKIATIETLNVGLEHKVRERTADLAEANAHLQAALEDLQAAQDQLVITGRLAAVGRLLAGIAHEINNPVNAISNVLEPMAGVLSELERTSGGDTQVGQDLLVMTRIIERGTRRIQKIVERVTCTLSTDASVPVPVDLLPAVTGSMDLLGEPLHGIEVRLEIPDGVKVMAQPVPLEQVFTNLFVNAAHAMKDRDERRLTVRATLRVGRVIVEVEDTGSGMSEAVLEKIFDPFFTTKDVGEGMGLGLSIVYDILTRCGAQLEVTSREGQGTTFKLSFLTPDPT
jgi:signal transduction histidine kinase